LSINLRIAKAGVARNARLIGSGGYPDLLGANEIARVQFLRSPAPPSNPTLTKSRPSFQQFCSSNLLNPIAHLLSEAVCDQIDVPAPAVVPGNRRKFLCSKPD
jgi:hypothetical protein